MPEKQNVEWKSKWNDRYLEWICGFANAQGGKLYIGCDDNGKVIGASGYRKLLEDLPNKIQTTLGIVADINLLEQEGRYYIEIVVPPYEVAVSYKGIYYYRSGSTNQVLNGASLSSFLLRKRGVTWDNMPLPSFTLDDIDDNAVEYFKKKAAKRGRIDQEDLNEPKDVLMEKLSMMNGNYFTNACMLLFGKNPDKWQVGAYTKIGFFETDSDLLYQDEIHGPILEQIDKIVDLVYLKYMKARISYDGLQRTERYFLPEEALREAILNALCHKQYESGVPVQISVYEDQVYIANAGRLPDRWTIDNLMKKHPSKPYNPNIASVLYKAGFIESWGRGVKKMMDACEQAEVPKPEFMVNPEDIMIHFKAPDGFINRHIWKPNEVTEKEIDKLTEKETELLNLLEEDPGYSYKDLSEKLHLSRKTISLYIKNLKDLGYVKRIGSKRTGYWKLKEQEK